MCRSDECDIRINISTVSSMHARLEYRSDGQVQASPYKRSKPNCSSSKVWIEQVTTNKGAHTDVNGRVLSKGMYLKNNDSVCIGGRVFRYSGESTIYQCPWRMRIAKHALKTNKKPDRIPD